MSASSVARRARAVASRAVAVARARGIASARERAQEGGSGASASATSGATSSASSSASSSARGVARERASTSKPFAGSARDAVTRAGSTRERDGAFRSRRSVDATEEVEWDGQTFSGSRLEYAGVEVSGELRWPIPLNALAEVNPELKELLDYAKTSDGVAERRMAESMSVLKTAENANSASSKDAHGGRNTSVVSTSSSGVRGTNAVTTVPGLVQFEQFLFESAWRVDAERRATARSVRNTLVNEAKTKTPLKVNTDDAPLSKTMLSKIKLDSLREATKTLDLEQAMQGVTKKPDVIAYLLAYYEYMYGSVEARTGLRLSEASTIGARILEEADQGSSTLTKRKNARSAPKPNALEYETDENRMDYVKAFKPEELVQLLVRARGMDVMAINVRDQCTWTDFLIIATARSAQHLKALAGAVLHAVKARTEYVAGGQLQPIIEGAQNGDDKDWMAVDCGSCMVHVFSPEGRERYNLEELWADGTEVVHNAPERLTLANIGGDTEDTEDHHTG